MQRFREGFTLHPADARSSGRLWDRDRQAGRAAAARGRPTSSPPSSRAHGVDFSFAPVLDLDYRRELA